MAQRAATGMTDFSRVGQGPIFAFPSLFHFGAPKFEVAAIFSMLIVIMVVLVETAADILAVGDIIHTDIDAGRLGDGLRADMLSSAVAPCSARSRKARLRKTWAWWP